MPLIAVNQRRVILAHPSGDGEIAKPMPAGSIAGLPQKPNEFLPRVNSIPISTRAENVGYRHVVLGGHYPERSAKKVHSTRAAINFVRLLAVNRAGRSEG
jgi:hypothetical protein